MGVAGCPPPGLSSWVADMTLGAQSPLPRHLLLAVWRVGGVLGDFCPWHLGQGPSHSFLLAGRGTSGLVEQNNPTRGLLSHTEIYLLL